jgi:hypothetical protein
MVRLSLAPTGAFAIPEQHALGAFCSHLDTESMDRQLIVRKVRQFRRGYVTALS